MTAVATRPPPSPRPRRREAPRLRTADAQRRRSADRVQRPGAGLPGRTLSADRRNRRDGRGGCAAAAAPGLRAPSIERPCTRRSPCPAGRTGTAGGVVRSRSRTVQDVSQRASTMPPHRRWRTWTTSATRHASAAGGWASRAGTARGDGAAATDVVRCAGPGGRRAGQRGVGVAPDAVFRRAAQKARVHFALKNVASCLLMSSRLSDRHCASLPLTELE